MISGKKILLTGASSGIGKETAIKLAKEGCIVYGIGRSFDGFDMEKEFEERERENFIPVVFDLLNTAEIPGLVKKLENGTAFDILINNAGVGYYGTHETLTPQQIHEMTVINLEVPMLLSSLLLKRFKSDRSPKHDRRPYTDGTSANNGTIGTADGTPADTGNSTIGTADNTPENTGKQTGGCIINISSVTADRINTHGCAYGATKAGLSSFGASLFEEARRYGVKVVNIRPDMTDTNLYRNADFTAAPDRDAHLDAADVADAVWGILNSPGHLAVTDITLRPQKHRLQKIAQIKLEN